MKVKLHHPNAQAPQRSYPTDAGADLNPSVLPAGLTQEEYMKICIQMLHICDTIYMLEGWEKSVGAKIEHSLAVQAGKPIIYE